MWLVLGYGSTVHGDDGVGPWVAAAVRALADPARVAVEAVVQLTPEYAELMARAEGVIFIDATLDLAPGIFRREALMLDQRPLDLGPARISHYCTPQGLLQSALALYGAAPPGWLYSIGGADFTLREGLSPAVAAAARRVAESVVRDCLPGARMVRGSQHDVQGYVTLESNTTG